MTFSYVLKLKILDGFAKKSKTQIFTNFSFSNFICIENIFLLKDIKNRSNRRSFSRGIRIYPFYSSNGLKNIFKIEKTLKIVFYFMKNGFSKTIRKPCTFSSKPLKTILKTHIFLLSSSSSIQPYIKRCGKILRFRHVTSMYFKLSS